MRVLVKVGRPEKHETHEQRFFARVKKTRGCWWWTGYVWNGRYGGVMVDGKTLLAHVYSYMICHKLKHRPKLNVLHECDQPLCVNPAHLFLGTQQENMADCARKGRLFVQYREHQ